MPTYNFTESLSCNLARSALIVCFKASTQGICSPAQSIGIVLRLYGRQNVRNVLNSNPVLIFVCPLRIGLRSEAHSWRSWGLLSWAYEKPACSHHARQDGLQLFLPLLERLGTSMCVAMVIIYKKTLEKKGADDVTSKSTDLDSVRLFSTYVKKKIPCLKYITLCLYVALPTDFSCACQVGRQQGVALNREIVASHSLLHSSFMALYYIFLFCQL